MWCMWHGGCGSQEQHLDLLAECASSDLASTCSLGLTLDSRTLDMVTIGEGPLNVWAIARQVCVFNQSSLLVSAV